MTSKERAALRSKANPLEAILHVGKGGVTDAVIAQADGALRTRELIKGRVLETSPQSAKEVCEEICGRTGADAIQVVGRVFVMYRYSPELHEEKEERSKQASRLGSPAGKKGVGAKRSQHFRRAGLKDDRPRDERSLTEKEERSRPAGRIGSPTGKKRLSTSSRGVFAIKSRKPSSHGHGGAKRGE